MPLFKGSSKEIMHQNMKELMREGKPQSQAVAMAMRSAGKGKKVNKLKKVGKAKVAKNRKKLGKPRFTHDL